MFVVVVVLVLVVISAPHSPAGTTAPDAMRVEKQVRLHRLSGEVFVDHRSPEASEVPCLMFKMHVFVSQDNINML